jgi:endonuclease YncB( thermonuclease family)
MKLLTAMVAAFVCSPAIAADYLGKVLAVSDGDTFTMEADGAKVRVRICGIDAPERGQAGYGQATGAGGSALNPRLLVHSGFTESAGEAVEDRLHDVLEKRTLSGLDVNVGRHAGCRDEFRHALENIVLV